MKKFETLFLHVGLEKTGTTSIQRALDSHRKKIEAQGYYYPKAFAIGRNTLLAAMFHPAPMQRASFASVINQRGGSKESHIEFMAKALDEELAVTNAKNLILSSEFLAAHCDIGELKAFCDNLANKTKIVIYLREQTSLMRSLYSTHIKGGGTEFKPLEQASHGQVPGFLDFKKIIGKFEKFYDRGDIQIRLFDRNELVNQSAIADFMHTIGLADLEGYEMERQNESLSQSGMHFLKAINVHFPNFLNGEHNKARGQLIQDIGELDASGKFGKINLAGQKIESIRASVKPGNDWVCAHYFPQRETLFSANTNTAQNKVSPKKVIDYSARLIAKVYRTSHDLRQEISDLKKENKELRRDNANLQEEALRSSHERKDG